MTELRVLISLHCTLSSADEQGFCIMTGSTYMKNWVMRIKYFTLSIIRKLSWSSCLKVVHCPVIYKISPDKGLHTSTIMAVDMV